MTFLHRNRVALVCGALLLLSLVLISTGARTPPRADPLSDVMLEVMRPLQAAVAATVDAIGSVWHEYVALVGVGRENEKLRRRISELEQNIVRLAEVEATDRRLAELLRFRALIDGDVQAAQIIARDPMPWFSTIVINKGDSDGVGRGMAVVSPYGVVGRTITTSSHAARVMLITDHNSGVDAVVQRTRARGIVEGGLDGRCVMKYLKRDEEVAVDDRVVTSGLDGVFPKGIVIGVVRRVTRGNRGMLQVAEIEPSVPLEDIEEVLVVRATQEPVP